MRREAVQTLEEDFEQAPRAAHDLEANDDSRLGVVVLSGEDDCPHRGSEGVMVG